MHSRKLYCLKKHGLHSHVEMYLQLRSATPGAEQGTGLGCSDDPSGSLHCKREIWRRSGLRGARKGNSLVLCKDSDCV